MTIVIDRNNRVTPFLAMGTGLLMLVGGGARRICHLSIRHSTILGAIAGAIPLIWRATPYRFHFSEKDEIGRGSHSTICEGTVAKWRKVRVAVSVTRNTNLERIVGGYEEIAKLGPHSNLLQLYLCQKPTRHQFIFAMTRMETDLKETPPKSYALAFDFTVQITKGLKHIHGADLAHRDVKPENILRKGRRVRIADFGFVQGAIREAGDRYERRGSALWMPPESCDPELGAYDYRDQDLWGLGVVAWQMLYAQGETEKSFPDFIERARDAYSAAGGSTSYFSFLRTERPRSTSLSPASERRRGEWRIRAAIWAAFAPYGERPTAPEFLRIAKRGVR